MHAKQYPAQTSQTYSVLRAASSFIDERVEAVPSDEALLIVLMLLIAANVAPAALALAQDPPDRGAIVAWKPCCGIVPVEVAVGARDTNVVMLAASLGYGLEEAVESRPNGGICVTADVDSLRRTDAARIPGLKDVEGETLALDLLEVDGLARGGDPEYSSPPGFSPMSMAPPPSGASERLGMP